MSKFHLADIPGLMYSLTCGPDEIPPHVMERVRTGEFRYQSVADPDGEILYSELVRSDAKSRLANLPHSETPLCWYERVLSPHEMEKVKRYLANTCREQTD